MSNEYINNCSGEPGARYAKRRRITHDDRTFVSIKIIIDAANAIKRAQLNDWTQVQMASIGEDKKHVKIWHIEIAKPECRTTDSTSNKIVFRFISGRIPPPLIPRVCTPCVPGPCPLPQLR